MEMSGVSPQISVYDDLDQLAHAAAEVFAQHSEASHGDFHVALSGGSTPEPIHRLVATSPYRERIAWERVQFYWGDERCVPPDDEQSNYRMARETLLDYLGVRAEQIHRMRGELPPVEAAADYEQVLRATFNLAQGELPRFELVLLGMGPDGHMASLFPHTAALRVRDRLAVANEVPQLQTTRITLTVPVFNNGATVVFAIAGADKADALAAVLHGPANPEQYPSQLIAPTNGELLFLIDRAAAAKL
jgi:6-phosphogluconolactonase